MKKRKTLQPKAEGQPLEYDEGARRVGGAPEAAVPVDSRIACEKRARELLEHMREDGEYDRYFEIDGEDAKLFHTWIKERLGATGTLPSNELYVVAYLEEDRTVAMVSLSGSKHRAAGWYLQIADGVQATRFFGPFDTPQKAFTAVPTTPETPEGRTAAKYSCSNNHEPVFYSADRCPVCVVLTGLAAVHEAEHRSLKASEGPG